MHLIISYTSFSTIRSSMLYYKIDFSFENSKLASKGKQITYFKNMTCLDSKFKILKDL